MPHHDQAESRMTHPTFCMQVLGYWVNVRDQSFLGTVFKNILQGRWSIKQANVACRNKAMHTKLKTAVQFNLEEHATTSAKDLTTTVSLAAVGDLVEEICGWTTHCCKTSNTQPHALLAGGTRHSLLIIPCAHLTMKCSKSTEGLPTMFLKKMQNSHTRQPSLIRHIIPGN